MPSESRNALDRIWEYKFTGVALMLPLAVLCAYWYWRVPGPGKAVGALAVASVIMGFRGQISGREKVAWTLVLFALLFVELRAIDHDRQKNDQEQAGARKEARKQFDADQQKFSAILVQNQQDFEATEHHLESLIQSGAKLQDLTKQNLESSIGGSSYCYLDFGFPDPPKGELYGIIWIHGKYPLHDAWMNVLDVPKFNEFTQRVPKPYTLSQMMKVGRQQINLGDLPPGTGGNGHENGDESQRMITEITFDDKTDKDYNILFGALNGNWRERLKLKRVDGQWKRALRVTKAKSGKIIWENVDPLYPKVNGKVEWEN